MSIELKKLQSAQNHQEKESASFKKSFFKRNADLIFDLVENQGLKYAVIIDAIAKDGVVFSYDYFQRLMAAEKKRRKESGIGIAAAKPAIPSNRSQPASPVKPVMKGKTSAQDMSPEKQEYIATLEEIKNRSDLSSKERRVLMKEAEEKFSNTLSKLGR